MSAGLRVRLVVSVASMMAASLAPVAGAQSISRLWANNCASCHGDDGEGGGAGTKSLLVAEARSWLHTSESDRAFYNAIRDGVPDQAMPGFKETMSPKEMWGLVVHIRELQERARKKDVKPLRPDDKGVVKSQRASFTIEDAVTDGLDVPWAVGFVPGAAPKAGDAPSVAGSMLVTNRGGEVMLVRADGTTKVIKGTPPVFASGQGGMMDVIAHPEFEKNGWIYLSFSDPSKGTTSRGNGLMKVVRGKVVASGEDLAWREQQVIWQAKPEHYLSGGIHFGSRIVFDPAGVVKDGPDKGKRRIFFCLGERGRGELAQDLTRPNGKVYRLNDDGSVPADNPFVGKEDEAKGVYPAIWSYGHRNPQGLTFDLEGNLWDTEHGPRGGDELNLIEKSRNYGWPLVAFSINYNGAAYRTAWPDTESEDVVAKNIKMPTMVWLPSIAVCGLATVNKGAAGEAFPDWRGDLMAGGLAGQVVERLRLKDGKVIEREEILRGKGRVRDVKVGPDGSVYVVLNGPDKVVRLVPAGK